MTIRVWNLDQGKRSIRAGMVLRIDGDSAVSVADAIVYLRVGVFPERLFTPVIRKHTASELLGKLIFRSLGSLPGLTMSLAWLTM
jgi:hypothetical protein